MSDSEAQHKSAADSRGLILQPDSLAPVLDVLTLGTPQQLLRAVVQLESPILQVATGTPSKPGLYGQSAPFNTSASTSFVNLDQKASLYINGYPLNDASQGRDNLPGMSYTNVSLGMLISVRTSWHG